MAEQRQPFRFRLPWQSAPVAPPPPRPSSESQPPRPKIETQTPTQSSTDSIQRPPFRPAGIASSVLPPPSPPVASKPRSAPQTRAEAPSTSRAAPQTGASGSVPSSPSQQASGTTTPPISRLSTPPADPRTSQPSSPSKLKPTNQESSQPLAVATQPPSSFSEKESKTTSKLDGVTTRPTEVSQTSPTQKLDSNAIGDDAKPKSEEREVVREIVEEKTNGSSFEDPTKKTITAESQEKQKSKQINIASSRHPKERRSSSTLTTQKPSVISNGEQLPLHEEVRKDISKYVQKLTTSQSDYKKPVSVITLSGENRGASMQLGFESTKTDEFVPIHRGYKLNQDESTEATTDGEGSSTDKRSRDIPTPKENPPSRAYVNSNVQSVNNSILFDTWVTENNPGVRLVLSNKQEEPIKSNGKLEPLETHKAEFNVTPAEKLTYQPTVRRRCLRGLFMEPSDSDPDNPEKPRRHGCRYNSCGLNLKDKEKEIGEL